MILDQEALKEGEILVKKHDKLISAMDKALKENASYGAGLDDGKKVRLATMLETFSKEYERRSKKVLTEAGMQVADVAGKFEYLNLIAAVLPTLVAEDVASVQPLAIAA